MVRRSCRPLAVVRRILLVVVLFQLEFVVLVLGEVNPFSAGTYSSKLNTEFFGGSACLRWIHQLLSGLLDEVLLQRKDDYPLRKSYYKHHLSQNEELPDVEKWLKLFSMYDRSIEKNPDPELEPTRLHISVSDLISLAANGKKLPEKEFSKDYISESIPVSSVDIDPKLLKRPLDEEEKAMLNLIDEWISQREEKEREEPLPVTTYEDFYSHVARWKLKRRRYWSRTRPELHLALYGYLNANRTDDGFSFAKGDLMRFAFFLEEMSKRILPIVVGRTGRPIRHTRIASPLLPFYHQMDVRDPEKGMYDDRDEHWQAFFDRLQAEIRKYNAETLADLFKGYETKGQQISFAPSEPGVSSLNIKGGPESDHGRMPGNMGKVSSELTFDRLSQKALDKKLVEIWNNARDDEKVGRYDCFLTSPVQFTRVSEHEMLEGKTLMGYRWDYFREKDFDEEELNARIRVVPDSTVSGGSADHTEGSKKMGIKSADSMFITETELVPFGETRENVHQAALDVHPLCTVLTSAWIIITRGIVMEEWRDFRSGNPRYDPNWNQSSHPPTVVAGGRLPQTETNRTQAIPYFLSSIRYGWEAVQKSISMVENGNGPKTNSDYAMKSGDLPSILTNFRKVISQLLLAFLAQVIRAHFYGEWVRQMLFCNMFQYNDDLDIGYAFISTHNEKLALAPEETFLWSCVSPKYQTKNGVFQKPHFDPVCCPGRGGIKSQNKIHSQSGVIRDVQLRSKQKLEEADLKTRSKWEKAANHIHGKDPLTKVQMGEIYNDAKEDILKVCAPKLKTRLTSIDTFKITSVDTFKMGKERKKFKRVISLEDAIGEFETHFRDDDIESLFLGLLGSIFLGNLHLDIIFPVELTHCLFQYWLRTYSHILYWLTIMFKLRDTIGRVEVGTAEDENIQRGNTDTKIFSKVLYLWEDLGLEKESSPAHDKSFGNPASYAYFRNPVLSRLLNQRNGFKRGTMDSIYNLKTTDLFPPLVDITQDNFPGWRGCENIADSFLLLNGHFAVRSNEVGFTDAFSIEIKREIGKRLPNVDLYLEIGGYDGECVIPSAVSGKSRYSMLLDPNEQGIGGFIKTARDTLNQKKLKPQQVLASRCMVINKLREMDFVVGASEKVMVTQDQDTDDEEREFLEDEGEDTNANANPNRTISSKESIDLVTGTKPRLRFLLPDNQKSLPEDHINRFAFGTTSMECRTDNQNAPIPLEGGERCFTACSIDQEVSRLFPQFDKTSRESQPLSMADFYYNHVKDNKSVAKRIESLREMDAMQGIFDREKKGRDVQTRSSEKKDDFSCVLRLQHLLQQTTETQLVGGLHFLKHCQIISFPISLKALENPIGTTEDHYPTRAILRREVEIYLDEVRRKERETERKRNRKSGEKTQPTAESIDLAKDSILEILIKLFGYVIFRVYPIKNPHTDWGIFLIKPEALLREEDFSPSSSKQDKEHQNSFAHRLLEALKADFTEDVRVKGVPVVKQVTDGIITKEKGIRFDEIPFKDLKKGAIKGDFDLVEDLGSRLGLKAYHVKDERGEYVGGKFDRILDHRRHYMNNVMPIDKQEGEYTFHNIPNEKFIELYRTRIRKYSLLAWLEARLGQT